MVKEGDYLLAVNGRPLRVPQNPDELFVNTVNQTDTLSINSRPTETSAQRGGAADPERVWLARTPTRGDQPAQSGASQRRADWLCLLAGYRAQRLNQFVKQYFPQIRREGMILDLQYNGGGFVDQIIFERLPGGCWRGWIRPGIRNRIRVPTSNVFNGHMA